MKESQRVTDVTVVRGGGTTGRGVAREPVRRMIMSDENNVAVRVIVSDVAPIERTTTN
jgi:hypothetical protein